MPGAIIILMDKEKRMSHVRRHFDSEAGAFDEHVLKVVPYYREMLDALVLALPYPNHKKIKIMDLGCGTGTITYLIKSRFPNAEVKCVDVSQNMLDKASNKLKKFSGIEYELADLHEYRIKEKYDAIVASLALHHLETDKDKTALHKKIFKGLKKGGVFFNADITVSKNKGLQNKYLKKWEKFILKSMTEEFAKHNYGRYKREDRPSVLLDELERLKKIGFSHIEILWKYYNFAVYCAEK